MGNELFDYPFKVEVWGTVSDWVLTVATIITLVFIYKTFKSQIVVQRSQVDLLQIEIDRFIKENKPFFKLVEFHFEDLKKDEGTPNLVFHLKKFGDLDALGLKVVSHKDFTCEVLSDDLGIKANTEIALMFFVKEELKEFARSHFHAFVIFRDRYDKKYRQVLNVIKTKDNKLEASISSISMNDAFLRVATLNGGF